MSSTSVYLPDEISLRLKKFSDTAGVKSTNSIIVAALSEYLDKHESIRHWSNEFLQWGGEEEVEGLEIDRADWREIEL